MKKITKIILSLMTVLCVAFYTVGANAQEMTGSRMRQPNMDSSMSVTVHVGDGIREKLSAVPPEDGTICFDLYRIADITGDGFTYQVTEKYLALAEELSKASTLSDSGSAPDWQALAQQAFALAVGGEGTVVNTPSGADYTGLSLDVKNTVSKGLYLLVARETLENRTIVKSVSAVDADGGNHYADSQYAVCATAGADIYTIMPQIICVPTKLSADGSTAVSTLADGEWVYDQQIVLKMSVEPASGSIRIDKTLTGHTGDEEVICVFRVDAYYPTADVLYSSEVYSVAFDASGSKSLLIEGLPIGALVHVTEVYSGANYVSSVPAPGFLDVTVRDGETASVAFTNTRDNERSGGGITNHFTYQIKDGVGAWDWTQATDNTQAVNGSKSTDPAQDSGLGEIDAESTNG